MPGRALRVLPASRTALGASSSRVTLISRPRPATGTRRRATPWGWALARGAPGGLVLGRPGLRCSRLPGSRARRPQPRGSARTPRGTQTTAPYPGDSPPRPALPSWGETTYPPAASASVPHHVPWPRPRRGSAPPTRASPAGTGELRRPARPRPHGAGGVGLRG